MNKKNCNSCNNTYDSTLNECPVCHTQNNEQPKRFKKLTQLSVGKQIALFLVGWLCLEIVALVTQYSLIISNGLETEEAIKEFFADARIKMFINTLCYFVVAGGLFAVINVDIKKFFKSFKNWRPYVAAAVGVAIIIAFETTYTILVKLCGFNMGGNGNQDEINKVVSTFPFTSLIVFGILGPVCEELTYRVGLFSLCKRAKTWLAFFITIVFFTLIHCDLESIFSCWLQGDFFNAYVINELVNIPIYACGAFVLTFLYNKYGFASSLTAHVLNNVISLGFTAILSGVIR